jgi:hypothetical protein
MNKKFIIPFLISLVTYQVNAVELEEPISVYVNDACANELLDYCNKTPQLISFLIIYAENFEGYMQSEKKDEIKRMFNKYYIAELCIKNMYPKNYEEITARTKSYLLYSKERFSLFIKSDRKLYESNVQLPEIPKEGTTEYCNSTI